MLVFTSLKRYYVYLYLYIEIDLLNKDKPNICVEVIKILTIILSNPIYINDAVIRYKTQIIYITTLLNSIPLLETISLYCIYYAIHNYQCLEYLIEGILFIYLFIDKELKILKEIVKFTYSKSPTVRDLSVRTLNIIHKNLTFSNPLSFSLSIDDIISLSHSSYLPIACFGLDV